MYFWNITRTLQFLVFRCAFYKNSSKEMLEDSKGFLPGNSSVFGRFNGGGRISISSDLKISSISSKSFVENLRKI